MDPTKITIGEKELQALDKLVIILKKKETGYKASVILMEVLGLATLALAIYEAVNGGASIILFVLAALELWLGVFGLKSAVCLKYRSAVSKLSQRYSPTVFDSNGVTVGSAAKQYPWSIFNGYTRVGDTLWVVSAYRKTQCVVYANEQVTPPETFANIMRLLAENKIPEIKTEDR